MKLLKAVVILFFVLGVAPFSFAAERIKDKQLEDDLLSSVVGSYYIIGCLPESTQTVFGQVVFKKQGPRLIFERIIDGGKLWAKRLS
jgi:hypothetical protein